MKKVIRPPAPRARGRPRKEHTPMAQTPKNQVLSGHKTPEPATPTQPETPPSSSDYPKALFHTDSKPGALVSRVVNSPEEEKELGEGWGPLSALDFETAPAAKEE